MERKEKLQLIVDISSHIRICLVTSQADVTKCQKVKEITDRFNYTFHDVDPKIVEYAKNINSYRMNEVLAKMNQERLNQKQNE
jgi:hypothetical protein